jgi:hypothetical protein
LLHLSRSLSVSIQLRGVVRNKLNTELGVMTL